MAQKLILPINNCRLTASWKTAAYYNKYRFAHYGIDMVSTTGNPLFYASGVGEVVAVGQDNVVGNVLAVRYEDAFHGPSGRSWDLIFRYFHMASVRVTVGQKVTKDTVLGHYGRTGMLEMAPHLHLEADVDTKYPLYSPTVKAASFIRGTALGATDKTMFSPLDFLYCKVSPPDKQSYSTTNDAFIREEDKGIGQIV